MDMILAPKKSVAKAILLWAVVRSAAISAVLGWSLYWWNMCSGSSVRKKLSMRDRPRRYSCTVYIPATANGALDSSISNQVLDKNKPGSATAKLPTSRLDSPTASHNTLSVKSWAAAGSDPSTRSLWTVKTRCASRSNAVWPWLSGARNGTVASMQATTAIKSGRAKYGCKRRAATTALKNSFMPPYSGNAWPGAKSNSSTHKAKAVSCGDTACKTKASPTWRVTSRK